MFGQIDVRELSDKRLLELWKKLPLALIRALNDGDKELAKKLGNVGNVFENEMKRRGMKIPIKGPKRRRAHSKKRKRSPKRRRKSPQT